MSPASVACLCPTNRPAWRPWLEHQFDKQSWKDKRLFIDDSEATIPEKRTALLARARGLGFGYVAWFDDDDWQHQDRLAIGMCAAPWSEKYGKPHAVGNVRSWFISVETGKAVSYQAPEGIIFNGAVFKLDKCPEAFERARHTGEDTEWLAQWHRRKPSYLIVPTPLSMWLCHRQNVTNRAETRAFTETPPPLINETEWRLVPR